jgi:Fe-S cluster assembly protein SufD
VSEPANAIEFYRAEFARLRDRVRGARSFGPARDAAMAEFERIGFPTTRDEQWKYTNVSALARHRYATAAPLVPAPSPARLDAFELAGLERDVLVFVDGHHQHALSRVVAHAGVSIETLSGAAARDEAFFDRIRAPQDASSFVALNAALFQDAVSIDVAPGTRVARPIEILHLAAAARADLAQYPRIVVRLGEHAQATVIEHYAGFAEAGNFTNAVSTIELAAGAVLDHYKLQAESAQAQHIGWLEVTMGANSRCTQHSVSFGARLARHDIRVRLTGPGAEVTLNGLYLARARQHVDHHLRVDHLVAHTTSREEYRGVLNDHARGVFNGKVVVHPDAQKSSAHQSSRNLLLAATAEADTKPELEIYADDVKCSHGATVGQLDAAALFYLRSRGIDLDTARSLLVYAFADDIMARIALPALRRRLEADVLSRLPDAERLREFT